MTDRFDHRFRIDQIRDGDRIDITADGEERAAIAERFAIESIDRLEAHAVLSRTGDAIRAQGRLGASLTQCCVVTGDPVTAHVDEPFDLMFVPEPQDGGADEEVELGEQDCDVIFTDGATIDIGGAIADTLALSLDPYPRSASADAGLKEAGVMSEEQASPFAVLAQLKRNDTP